MPDIESSIWQRYKDQGVIVYGLHTGESPTQLADFIRQTGITFPVRVSNNTLFRFSFPSGVAAPYPRDVVIGKDLKVRSIKGSFDVNEMDALIQTLINEP